MIILARPFFFRHLTSSSFSKHTHLVWFADWFQMYVVQSWQVLLGNHTDSQFHFNSTLFGFFINPWQSSLEISTFLSSFWSCYSQLNLIISPNLLQDFILTSLHLIAFLTIIKGFYLLCLLYSSNILSSFSFSFEINSIFQLEHIFHSLIYLTMIPRFIFCQFLQPLWTWYVDTDKCLFSQEGVW